MLLSCIAVLLVTGACTRHPVIVGRFTPQAFADTARSWPDVWGTHYHPTDDAAMQQLAQADSFSLMAFCATWCHDSRREVPRLFSLSRHMPLTRFDIVALDTARTQRDPEDLYLKHGVRFTPTFILLRNGQELGRIVERTPKGESLETALARLAANP